MSLSGHFWTIVPNLWREWRPLAAPPSEPWQTTLADPQMGEVGLSGLWQPAGHTDTALVVVHGMGGAVDRHYCVRAAWSAARRGWACLRMGLRGSDRAGDDFHHAGLHADIGAAVTASPLAGFRRIFLLGYSLGGHTVIRYLCADPDPRVQGAATVCSPLDLDLAAAHIDQNAPGTYRRHLLGGLSDIYGAVDRRRSLTVPAVTVRAARTVREFDRLAVASRFGFTSAEDYYARESASAHLHRLERPVLFCASTRDPMLPPSALEPALENAPECLQVHWIDAGGHVNFPAGVNLGLGVGGTLEDQLLHGLESAG